MQRTFGVSFRCSDDAVGTDVLAGSEPEDSETQFVLVWLVVRLTVTSAQVGRYVHFCDF